MKNTITALILLFFITGCSSFATFNEELPPGKQLKDNRAQFSIERDRGNDGTLFILALSGGGSRAAYLSSQVMLALQEIPADKGGRNLLQSIDAMSSVSGGSLPAAYYAISKDPDDQTDNVASGRVWDRDTVEELMTKNYILRWIANWFWPDNIALYWATAYDRSDMMAQIFADNLYDTLYVGRDLKFKEINKERPYLVINSTSGTTDDFGEIFTFTHDDFKEKLGSDISEYHISRAVMASASFPAVFNYMTLRDFSYIGKGKKHIHIFDGGNFDNLGLHSAQKIINENDKYKNIVVLLVDAFTKPKGVPNHKYDALSGVDYAIDFNFMDSTDSLLQKVRTESLKSTQGLISGLNDKGKNAMFYHLSFNDISKFDGVTTKIKEYDFETDEEITREKPLVDVLNNISTNFNISDENADAIKLAVKLLVTKDNTCIQRIQAMVNKTPLKNTNSTCRWPTSRISFAKSQ